MPLLRNTPHTFSHNRCTSASDSCLQAIKLSIHPSRVPMFGASTGAEISCDSGILPTSSILISILSNAMFRRDRYAGRNGFSDVAKRRNWSNPNDKRPTVEHERLRAARLSNDWMKTLMLSLKDIKRVLHRFKARKLGCCCCGGPVPVVLLCLKLKTCVACEVRVWLCLSQLFLRGSCVTTQHQWKQQLHH